MSDDSIQISVRLRRSDPLERQLIDQWYDRLPSNRRGKEGVQRRIVEALCLYTGIGHEGNPAAVGPPASRGEREAGDPGTGREPSPDAQAESNSGNEDFADAFDGEI